MQKNQAIATALLVAATTVLLLADPVPIRPVATLAIVGAAAGVIASVGMRAVTALLIVAYLLGLPGLAHWALPTGWPTPWHPHLIVMASTAIACHGAGYVYRRLNPPAARRSAGPVAPSAGTPE